ncbi:AIM24 family protein [Mariniblastus sp.]|nr:AIM24 family protein [Mariniblastus sp.]
MHTWVYMQSSLTGEKEVGPIAEAEFISLIRKRKIKGNTKVASATRTKAKWYQADQVPTLNKIMEQLKTEKVQKNHEAPKPNSQEQLSNESVRPPKPSVPPPQPPNMLPGSLNTDWARPHDEPFKVKQTANGHESVVDIIEHPPLKGCHNMGIAQSLYFAHQQGMMLRQARITLNQGACKLQAGMLQFLRGSITIETDIKGVGGFLKGAVKAMATQETTAKPRYSGTGQIFLEPTFGQLEVVELENEKMVIADGMFYAVESTIDIKITPMAKLSTGFFGGQGFLQTELSGKGWVVLALPVPKNEILRYTLTGPDDELKVDGNFGLLRRGNISFTVEKSTKTLIGSAVSGEGLLQTYRGSGEVWVAPTMDVYSALSAGGLYAASSTDGTKAAAENASGVIEGISSMFSSD